MTSRNQLAVLFGLKCAFCETRIESVLNLNVGHFRPKDSAGRQRWHPRKTSSVSGKALPDGYWWLAYNWENLYPICSVCNSNKRNNFSIDGPRAAPGAIEGSLVSERPLLLDPCIDHAERFLHFRSDGTVIPQSADRVQKIGRHLDVEVPGGTPRPEAMTQSGSIALTSECRGSVRWPSVVPLR
jgi:hypothetical protein